MKKDPQVFLQHILESIGWIEFNLKGLSQEAFSASIPIQDSVVRRLEIIGEAVKNIPEEFKTFHSDIPWREITGMRDKLIHEYFSIDEKLLWDTITKDIPLFKEQIKKLLAKDDTI